VGSGYTVRIARPDDLAAFPEIERAASQLLRDHAPQSILDETTSEPAFREAQEAGRLWIALAADRAVGFALVEMLADDLPHLEELGVHPDHGRRGVGTALVRVPLLPLWLAPGGDSLATGGRDRGS
jgi:ribosomal protein S18 acetylase RimI-like enzyme